MGYVDGGTTKSMFLLMGAISGIPVMMGEVSIITSSFVVEGFELVLGSSNKV